MSEQAAALAEAVIAALTVTGEHDRDTYEQIIVERAAFTRGTLSAYLSLGELPGELQAAIRALHELGGDK